MRTRLDLLETLPKGGYGAELGVFEGDFAREILRVCQPKFLWLVDLFDGVVRSGDQNGENVHNADMREMGPQLAREFAQQPVRVVRSCSYEWLDGVEDAVLDFIYIDTDHTWGTTLRELWAARRAVKDGGVIAGHDYSPHFPGVTLAVDSFCAAFKPKLEVWDGDRLPSYRICNSK